MACRVVIVQAVKSFPGGTNSYVITAALMAVIIGSLCFSVGEGLRLTPFANSVLSSVSDSDPVVDVAGQGSRSAFKYGPLDVPAQTQKRGKRNVVDLAAGPRAKTQPVFASFFRSSLSEINNPDCLSLVAPPPGRAPPLHS
jgi:hypothetical protein